MAEEPTRAIRVIHDLERAIRHWELLRDSAQREVNETMAYSEKERDSIESTRRVAKFQAYIANCNAWILEARARIDELARGD
jgi:hypothetical protein